MSFANPRRGVRKCATSVLSSSNNFMSPKRGSFLSPPRVTRRATDQNCVLSSSAFLTRGRAQSSNMLTKIVCSHMQSFDHRNHEKIEDTKGTQENDLDCTSLRVDSQLSGRQNLQTPPEYSQTPPKIVHSPPIPERNLQAPR